jgi:predicted dehydrogenase
MIVKIALVGLGYWGPNLARNLASLKEVQLYMLCDLCADRLAQFSRQYPEAHMTSDYDAVINAQEIDGVVIATPVHTHFALAKRALQAGKHVMVEKPLAQTSAQCRELIALAEHQGLTLMAGHVFIYNPAVRKVKEYIDSGLLGQIYYIYSQRLNLGIIRQDVNALWNFAPHDISIINHWLGAAPIDVVVRGYSYVQPGIEDVVFMTLDYPGGVGANVHISWLDPHKIRRMTIVGSEKMVVYDDVSADARIIIYDKGVTRKHNASTSPNPDSHSLGRYETFGEFQLLLRAGDVLIPKLDFAEPLKLECQHFIDCIRTGQQAMTDGYDGLRVVQVLEAAQASLALDTTHTYASEPSPSPIARPAPTPSLKRRRTGGQKLSRGGVPGRSRPGA